MKPALSHQRLLLRQVQHCCSPGHTPRPTRAHCQHAAAAAAPQPQQQQATSSHSTDAADAAIVVLVQQHGLDKDAVLVAQEARLTYTFLAASGSLPSSCSGVGDLLLHALQLSGILATGSTFRTLQMLKRQPGLLRLSPAEAACRVLQLKLLMPEANVPELLYQKPSLLLLQDIPGTISPALAKLTAIMPGIPVVRKLHEGTNAFCNFCSLLETSGSGLMKAASSKSTQGSSRHGSSAAGQQ
eukprot:GHRQ01006016.1.p1 GENE.GHRQ01006016.1~~GHRQ01006016.1.p1  ORF type:complete len:242 (+),score=108.98 GHRQ01006016.1:196-921(+)